LPSTTTAAGGAVPITGTAQSVRTVQRAHSLKSLADGVGQAPRGTKGPETPPGEGDPDADLQAVRAHVASSANRSLSPRPDAHATAASLQAAGTVPVPVAAPTAVSGAKPGLTTSFQGINLYQERYVANNGNQFSFEPPDQGMCVGNGFVLETINDALRVYSIDGKPLSPVIDTNSFYGYPPVIDRTTGVFGPEPTDPSCVFDTVNQRWIHIVLTLDVNKKDGGLTLNNHLDIAVSKTSSPLGGWNFYSINATDDGRGDTPKHTDCPCVGDYPHIGLDANGVYITTNEYPWSSDPGVFGTNFNGSQIYAISKKALTSGAKSVQVVQFSNVALKPKPHAIPGFTVIPANSPAGVFSNADGGTEFFVSSTAAEETANEVGRSNVLGFWTLVNTRSLGTNHLALSLRRQAVTSEAYGVPPLSEQKAGPTPLRDCEIVGCEFAGGVSPREVEGPLDSSDSRIFNTWYDGQHVWASLSTIVQVNGSIKAGSAWFRFDPTGALSRQGYIAVGNNNVIYPGIATLPNGQGAVGLNLVGGDWFPSQGYVLVGNNGPTGPIHVSAYGQGPEDGFCEYVVENCAGTDPPGNRPRWGDYPAAQAAGGYIWISNEYIAQSCTFKQYEADFTCGNTRGSAANWSTRLSRVSP